ncbi:hypothetical protein HOF92_03970 [bacterium]|jgi:hypothetical protein|nr:hypothetical protein [bacterium]
MSKWKPRLILYLSVFAGILSAFAFNWLVFTPLLVHFLPVQGWFWSLGLSLLLTGVVFAGMWDPCTHKISTYKRKHNL